MEKSEKIQNDVQLQKKMNKWIENYVQKQKEDDIIIKNITSTTNYLKWLIQFTQDKEGFCDDDWLYSYNQISENDKQNVELLSLFYEGIDNYAKKNHIYPIPCAFGNFYQIRLNNFGFEIGKCDGQGIVLFCHKIKVENKEQFIDFNDIINDKKQNNVDNINKTLKYLHNIIIRAYKNGIPIEAIVNVLETTINELKANNNSKQLIKK